MSPDELEIGRATRSREQAGASYSRLSKWYDLLAEGSEREARDLGLRLLGVREGETVLEIGFGTGHGLLSLARSVGALGRVCGIDPSPGMLEVARARIERAGASDRVDLTLGDALRLPFEDGTFDAIFVSFVLELFDTPEIPIVLAGTCRDVGQARFDARMNGRAIDPRKGFEKPHGHPQYDAPGSQDYQRPHINSFALNC